MNIILVAPKSISKDNYRLDYAYWNFYIPLLELGNQVHFFDSSKFGNKDLQKLIEKIKPDLIFCIMTGSSYYCPDEPWETIAAETTKGRTTTFNWFCDDSWRFDNFSKNACWFFHHCSTPEKKFLQNYQNINYNNIHYSTWHANSNLYSIDLKKKYPVSFVGRVDSTRSPFIDYLNDNSININIPKDVCFEDLVKTYAESLIGLNFSKNSTGIGTQIKARIFEITGCKAGLISEYNEEILNCFEEEKEVLLFKTKEELLDCLKKVQNEKFLNDLIISGHNKFIQNHTSHIRLSNLLQQIKK